MRVKRVNEGRSVDALACAGDEGRATLRKAVGSCEGALIRGYPNGETHFQGPLSDASRFAAGFR